MQQRPRNNSTTSKAWLTSPRMWVASLFPFWLLAWPPFPSLLLYSVQTLRPPSCVLCLSSPCPTVRPRCFSLSQSHIFPCLAVPSPLSLIQPRLRTVRSWVGISRLSPETRRRPVPFLPLAIVSRYYKPQHHRHHFPPYSTTAVTGSPSLRLYHDLLFQRLSRHNSHSHDSDISLLSTLRAPFSRFPALLCSPSRVIGLSARTSSTLSHSSTLISIDTAHIYPHCSLLNRRAFYDPIFYRQTGDHVMAQAL